MDQGSEIASTASTTEGLGVELMDFPHKMKGAFGAVYWERPSRKGCMRSRGLN